MTQPQTLAYASQSPSQVLDLYLPEGTTGSLPVIVLVHGGAFQFGDQKMPILDPIIQQALETGFAVASIDYRKSTEARFPGALADTKAAVRYLKHRAADLGLDTERFIIWGESAGAYLSLMTALTSTVASLNDDVSDYLDQSSSVAGLVSFYAPVNFATLRADYQKLGQDSPDIGRFESLFLGVDDVCAQPEAATVSYWKTYLNDLPAGFSLTAVVQVGDESDDKVPCLQSLDFAQDLKNVAGVTLHAQQFAGASHMDAVFYSSENIAQILALFQQ